jgi:hypothetical protein
MEEPSSRARPRRSRPPIRASPDAVSSRAACERLAEQFHRQAADVRELLAVLELDDEEELEEAAA